MYSDGISPMIISSSYLYDSACHPKGNDTINNIIPSNTNGVTRRQVEPPPPSSSPSSWDEPWAQAMSMLFRNDDDAEAGTSSSSSCWSNSDGPDGGGSHPWAGDGTLLGAGWMEPRPIEQMMRTTTRLNPTIRPNVNDDADEMLQVSPDLPNRGTHHRRVGTVSEK